MATTSSITGFDSSLLLNYFQARTTSKVVSSLLHNTSVSTAAAAAAKKATANDVAPWTQASTSTQLARDADILSITDIMDTSNVPTFSGVTTDAKLEQDNQKLFSLYTAVENLRYLADMSKREDTTTALMAGYNTRFQTGLSQIQSYIKSTTFNTITLQAAMPAASAKSTATVATPQFTYKGATVVSNDDIGSALSGVSASDSFNVTITKAGVATDVAIDLSQVGGELTLENIVSYVNQQLKDAGFNSSFKRVITKGSIADVSEASYGIQLTQGSGEKISLSSAGATPSLYLATTSGVTTSTASTEANNQGRLVKLTDLADPQGDFSATIGSTSGTTTAQSTVVDANGNIYVVGNATGDFGSQLNQGTQDVYLSKYDSAGNQLWSKLLGSAGTASGYSLALNPNGGVVIAGSTTADVMTNAVANGNTDSFVASYASDGTQNWVKQIQTLNQNQAASVSVDASGSVYIGGQVRGMIAAGQVAAGGQDAYIAKYDSTGKVVYAQQFGTASDDKVAATAINASGDLYVATVENGEAYLSKYTGGDATQAAAWKLDIGALQSGGTLNGLTVTDDGQIYISGTTQSGTFNATATNASSGSKEAFVFKATDTGASATADYLTYVGTTGIDTAGSLTVSSDGKVYLAGTTTGTFADQNRSVDGVNNAFVAELSNTGSIDWVRQYSGASGQATGQSVAIDPNGSSVLDALGLPHGSVSMAQNVTLASSTTLRTGDSFKIEIEGTGARTFTVTIAKGETMQSLAAKINTSFGKAGSAKVTYGSGGRGLTITVADGVTAKLIAGPEDSDALGRLGIAPGTITSPSKNTTTSTSSTSDDETDKQAFGLGLASTLDISTLASATRAYAQLTAVLSAIKNTYRTMNTTETETETLGYTGSVSAVTQSQLASYSTALSLLNASSSSSSTDSSGILGLFS
jgi:hypothetical protein